MARSLFLIILSMIGTVLGGMTNLMATDEVAISGLNPAAIVETVPLPAPQPVPAESEQLPAAPAAGTNTTPVVQTTYTEPAPVSEPAPQPVPTITNYTVTHIVGSTKEFNAIATNLSYSDIYKFHKMVYGHNASNLLLSLTNKYVGDTITVTENGITTTYQIVWRQEMYKLSATELQGRTDGRTYRMIDIADALDTYDLALETCSGYGNTPYRWVLFANKK